MKKTDSKKNIKLKYFLFLLDIVLIIAIVISSLIVYFQFKEAMEKEEEANYKKNLERTENFIRMQINNSVKTVELITKNLKEENLDILNEIDFVEASYFIDNNFRIEKIFFPYEVSDFIKKIDLKNSDVFNFIKNSKIKENESKVSPLGLSIITGKQTISVITGVKNGFYINDIKIKKIFDFFEYTNLYRDSVILILEPSNSTIIARSNQDIYPYYEFNKPGNNSMMLDSVKYRCDISHYPLLNINIAVLTPKDTYAVYFNLTKGFFGIIIILVLFFIILKSFISQKYNYEPFKQFLKSINSDPLKPVNLGNNFFEWHSLENAYNEKIKEIQEANKKIMQQYEEIQIQYEELESTYEELTNTNEELAQANQNLVEMNDKLIESENNLKVSLKEKEVLLKEVHHRVKNNLQLISSILSIQMAYLKEEKEKEFLFKIRNRIKTISLIHEDMYGKDNFSKIDFSVYIQKLISYLAQNNNYNRKIRIISEINEIFFDLTKAIPLGLIINELVVNAVTHAFDKNQEGEIKVKLVKENKKFYLTVEDNGKGIKSIDYENAEGFGLKLVSTLASQLNGVLEIEKNNGTIVNITFDEN